MILSIFSIHKSSFPKNQNFIVDKMHETCIPVRLKSPQFIHTGTCPDETALYTPACDF